MVAKRLDGITGIGLDRVAATAGSDPEILRLENLDTNIPVPAVALEENRRALQDDSCNSWLPLTGRMELREAVSQRLGRVLLALTGPGEEVSSPTRLTPGRSIASAWPVRFRDLSLSAYRTALGAWIWIAWRRLVTPKSRALFVMNPSMPPVQS